MTKIQNGCHFDMYTKFPECAKVAEVFLIYKKQDPLDKTNYRPVSVLTSTSKVLEKLLEKATK